MHEKNGKKRLNVMLGDFCYFNRHTLYARFTPLGIGMIAQYAKQKFGDDINVSLFKSAEKFLERAQEKAPDVVGLAVYYWSNSLNQYVVKRLRKMFGRNVIIVLGGPSIDSDEKEQKRFLLHSFPGADAVVINEGEIAFSNIIQKTLSDRKTVFKDPIDGLAFLNKNEVISGRPIGTSMDLSTLKSPYLSGLMDDFMNSDYQPLIQTSRFCPYTCAFCVSGKTRGKLRGFPIEQIEEELRYVSKKYADRPHHLMYLADENFGILKRDVEIAKAIKKCNEDFNYPQRVFFYNDKRFTQTSREVNEVLGKMTMFGLTLSLQTENPDALKAINRRNVTEEEIDSAITWASKLDLLTTTELIFGLPYETKKSFIDLLNRSINRGFDSILCNMLFIMDGIELNRPEIRDKFSIKTKYRPLSSNYGTHDGNFFAEYEEVVISTKSFKYEDFLEVRNLNFMFFTVFSLNFQKWFFRFIKHNKEFSLAELFSRFMNPDRNKSWPKKYLRFVDDFKAAVEGELYDSREEVIASLKKIYEANGNDVGEPTRINIAFSARLIYQENSWIKEVFLHCLNDMTGGKFSNEDKSLAISLIDLAELERIDLKKINENKLMNLSFDVIDWKRNKYKKPLQDLKMPARSIKFLVDNSRTSQITGFQQRFVSATNKDLYIQALDFITPRTHLLHVLKYDNNQNIIS